MSESRAVPFYCPFCGDEDLRPHEDHHGEWECRACMRVFSLKLIGLLSRGRGASPAAWTDQSPLTGGQA